jgi:RNase P subunit RPR2
MTVQFIELNLILTDHGCSNCGAFLYRVVQIGQTSTGSQQRQVLGLTCRSCEANGMRLLKGE